MWMLTGKKLFGNRQRFVFDITSDFSRR